MLLNAYAFGTSEIAAIAAKVTLRALIMFLFVFAGINIRRTPSNATI